MSIFRSDTKGSSIFVMNLVHLFVEWWPMHEAMHVIVIKVLENEKDSNLNSHLLPIEIFIRMESMTHKNEEQEAYQAGKGASTFIPRIVAIGWKKKMRGPSKMKWALRTFHVQFQ